MSPKRAAGPTPDANRFFVANLPDMFAGALTAPVSKLTIDALREARADDRDPTLMARPTVVQSIARTMTTGSG
jgi:hypothetical protein